MYAEISSGFRMEPEVEPGVLVSKAEPKVEPGAELLAVGAGIGRETYHGINFLIIINHYAYIKNLEPTQIFFRPNLLKGSLANWI